ncbi:SnoaL-like domain-containing protein [Sphingobium sp. AP50]|uniref:nuclear transport factor 2 family protein n=1 Tax=Sphingobium sp. AP50 TaxID=1884369 RepID=UPI0008AD93EF|nr:nuclear transport factor 2 family protein [Sphingobium sp. AP50]SEK00741.1 SnoaL-like domain-containing protein [Sphingobium sp. AP50]
MSEVELGERLRAVEDELAIRRTQARYAAFADAKYSPLRRRVDDKAMMDAAVEQAACFTAQARWDGGVFGGTMIGRDALAKWFAAPPWNFAMHYYVAPQIKIADNAADTRWRLWQVGHRAGEADPLLLAAITQQRFVRQADGEWLIDGMRFEQVQTFPLPPSGFPPVFPTTEIS